MFGRKVESSWSAVAGGTQGRTRDNGISFTCGGFPRPGLAQRIQRLMSIRYPLRT